MKHNAIAGMLVFTFPISGISISVITELFGMD